MADQRRTITILSCAAALVVGALVYRIVSAEDETEVAEQTRWVAETSNVPELATRDAAQKTLSTHADASLRERAAMAYADAVVREAGDVKPDARFVHGKEAVAPLITALKEDKNPHVRAMAAKAMRKVRSKFSLKPLVAAMEDDDPRVRDSAHNAFRRIMGVTLNFKGSDPPAKRKIAVDLAKEMVSKAEQMDDRVLNQGRRPPNLTP